MIEENQTAFIIANPRAGRMHRSRSREREWNGVPCNWHQTAHAGHAESLAYDASLRGFRWIVAAGGDGTIHEVLNGMLRNPSNRSILGWIAAGTANDYAASFRGDAFDPINHAPTAVDVGCMKWHGGCRFFANVAGIGFSGEIANRARSMPRMPARIRYTSSLLWQLGPRYGPRALSISFDDQPLSETETLFMSAAIGKHEGSYPLHLPADLTDGCFEILRIGRLPRSELARYFPAMLRGQLPVGHPEVHRTRCHRLEVVAQEGVPLHLDGELPKGAAANEWKRFTLEVLPQAIQCVDSPHSATCD